ncbi:hypothetical protein J6590_053031 [Homalodisca vitripennis]|nr:hypothetical protein J6590_053031 [Homalodisca vitripennis]
MSILSQTLLLESEVHVLINHQEGIQIAETVSWQYCLVLAMSSVFKPYLDESRLQIPGVKCKHAILSPHALFDIAAYAVQ